MDTDCIVQYYGNFLNKFHHFDWRRLTLVNSTIGGWLLQSSIKADHSHLSIRASLYLSITVYIHQSEPPCTCQSLSTFINQSHPVPVNHCLHSSIRATLYLSITVYIHQSEPPCTCQSPVNHCLHSSIRATLYLSITVYIHQSEPPCTCQSPVNHCLHSSIRATLYLSITVYIHQSEPLCTCQSLSTFINQSHSVPLNHCLHSSISHPVPVNHCLHSSIRATLYLSITVYIHQSEPPCTCQSLSTFINQSHPVPVNHCLHSSIRATLYPKRFMDKHSWQF